MSDGVDNNDPRPRRGLQSRLSSIGESMAMVSRSRLSKKGARKDVWQTQSRYLVRNAPLFDMNMSRDFCAPGCAVFSLASSQVTSAPGVKRRGQGTKSEDRYSAITGIKINIVRYSGSGAEAASTKTVNMNLFGVYDGHGGSGAAQFIQDRLAEQLKKSSFWVDPDMNLSQKMTLALEEAFSKVTEEWQAEAERTKDTSGAVVYLVLCGQGLLIFANLGDSQAVLGAQRVAVVDGTPVPSAIVEARAAVTTAPHIMENASERGRVERAGGWFAGGKGNRLMGSLIPTRTIGDADVSANAKGILATAPDFQTVCLKVCMDKLDGMGEPIPQPSDDTGNEVHYSEASWVEGTPFLVVASDGLWDVFTEAEVVRVVSDHLAAEKAAAAAAVSMTAPSQGSSASVVSEEMSSAFSVASSPSAVSGGGSNPKSAPKRRSSFSSFFKRKGSSKPKGPPMSISEVLLKAAQGRGSKDDVTVIVATFTKEKTPDIEPAAAAEEASVN